MKQIKLTPKQIQRLKQYLWYFNNGLQLFVDDDSSDIIKVMLKRGYYKSSQKELLNEWESIYQQHFGKNPIK